LRVADLELWSDPGPAGWVTEGISGFAVDVGSIIPAGFDSYARLLHPAYRRRDGADAEVPWSEVAASTGRTIHPEVQWSNLSGVREHSGDRVGVLWDQEPEVGTLPRRQALTLGDLVSPHTTTPEHVWFCVWSGYGGLTIDPGRRPAGSRGGGDWLHARSSAPGGLEPTVLLSDRDYHLFRGDISQVGVSYVESPSWQSANLWWPEDRAWFVATEIDLSWTYVGGSHRYIESILDAADLEAISAQITDRIAHDSDLLNPPTPDPDV